MRNCTITWTDEDVYSTEADYKPDTHLTEDEVHFILQSMEDSHDATIGITWDTIEFWIDRVIDKRENNEPM